MLEEPAGERVSPVTQKAASLRIPWVARPMQMGRSAGFGIWGEGRLHT